MTTQESIRERNETPQHDPDEIEIRLSDIVKFLKRNRWLVLRWALSFLVIGGLYAFSLPNEYTATVRVMPELKTAGSGGGLGDLKSLAGLAGFDLDNLNSNSEAIRPDLYPDIVQSLPFTLHLLQQPVTTRESGKPMLLQTYLKDQSAHSWLGWLMSRNDETLPPSFSSDKKTLQLTKDQEDLNKAVGKRVSAIIDKKSGIITITSQMQDPVVAATTAQRTLDYLTNYVTNYRTGKSRMQVQFLTQQVNNAKRRYQAAELSVSSYRDRNRNLFLETAKIQEQRLQSDYLLAQTVYNDLSKQLEQARIKVQEEAPVFQVLEPARIPLLKSGPKRLNIMLGFIAVGIMFGLAYAFFLTKRKTA
ncbi:uncharacterized protein involved in exopolysaccharide biosynthesis [Spirosoma lacussanchae]|uniref:Wzz/FepE/Etk N-terminal domain-containing protein n=1 Tax=Spirosoma lacussanchae TaxID=1884249 RepID=UPI00110970F3|nr:Wzz/FepE/Etk N-terminal domain-containing protein [Spirosoma lacussanchae]